MNETMNEAKPQRIKRVRNEVLISLKTFYPTAMEAASLYRALLAVFPDLVWPDFLKDLAYLDDKGYIRRAIQGGERDQEEMTTPRRRWWRLTSEGVEIADGCLHDPALEI